MTDTRYIVKPDAWEKWYSQPLTSKDFTPERMRAARAEQETGYLIETDRLFSAMYHEWDVLQKDVNTMTGAIQSLTFTAVAMTGDGEKPSERANLIAKTVNAALWHGAATPMGEWEHNLNDLIGSIYHALCRGTDVHEIAWAYDAAISLWYPRAYRPIPKTFYRWETQPGKRDRLLLFKDGVLHAGAEGRPFATDRFIVAMNTQGPDHPMRNALFFPLIGWFGAAHWGLTWLMRYCQIYGIPFKVYNIGSETDRARIQQAIESGGNPTDIILDTDDTVDIKATTTGTAIPQAELISMAEKHVHKLILGQTLTSDTSDGGSRAQAQVHSDVQAAEILAAGNYIAGILTAQLVPAIVRRNFGGTEGEPLPEIRCSLPGSKASMEKIDLWDGIINKLGMRVRKSDVYDDLGITIPGEEDETLGPVATPPPGLDSLTAAAAELSQSPKTTAPHELADMRGNEAEALLPDTVRAWTAPIMDAIRASRTPADLLERLKTVKPDTTALATGMERATALGLGIDLPQN